MTRQEPRKDLAALAVNAPQRAVLMALLLLLAWGAGSGCRTTWRQTRSDLNARERCVAELWDLAKQLKEALRGSRIDDAKEMVEELQQGIADADHIARSHPDFEDVRKLAERAPAALSQAIRHTVTKELDTPLARARELHRAASQRPLSTDEIDMLRETQELLQDKRSEMERLALPDLQSALRSVDATVSQLAKVVATAQWGRRLDDGVGATLREAHTDSTRASDGGLTVADRLVYAENATQKFQACSSAAAQARAETAAAPTLRLTTVLGSLTAEDVLFACQHRHEAMVALTAKLRTELALIQISEEITTAEQALMTAREPRDRVSALGSSREALRKCASTLLVAMAKPHFQPGVRAPTPFGKLGGRALKRVCEKKATRRGHELARLRRNLHEESQQPIDDYETLAAVRGILHRCIESGEVMGSCARETMAVVPPRQRQLVRRIVRECRQLPDKAACFAPAEITEAEATPRPPPPAQIAANAATPPDDPKVASRNTGRGVLLNPLGE